MEDDSRKAVAWLGIAGSVLAVLAFFGINNIEDVQRIFATPPEESAQPTADTAYATPTYDYSPDHTTEESATEDPGCDAASDTIHAYMDLIPTDNDQGTAAGIFADMASAFASDSTEAQDSDVEAALDALAADSRALSRATNQSDVASYRVASDQLSADLDDLNAACGWS
ncbi:hypothetical protein [Saccharopolyspora sp. CA-218241]|uniref:hypothetical protein n=1 Tax=Saccharopolyspora sp. CA-218241 TaxID=3240027 RepID=UPI003D951B2E